jgi:hypothetical protein
VVDCSLPSSKDIAWECGPPRPMGRLVKAIRAEWRAGQELASALRGYGDTRTADRRAMTMRQAAALLEQAKDHRLLPAPAR